MLECVIHTPFHFFFFYVPPSLFTRLARVPESLLKKRKTAEKYAAEKAITNAETKKVRCHIE